MTSKPEKPVEPVAPPAFPSELTPIGEQLVIPGCEKKAPASRPQLDLWG